jgi:hypothetical protein
MAVILIGFRRGSRVAIAGLGLGLVPNQIPTHRVTELCYHSPTSDYQGPSQATTVVGRGVERLGRHCIVDSEHYIRMTTKLGHPSPWDGCITIYRASTALLSRDALSSAALPSSFETAYLT